MITRGLLLWSWAWLLVAASGPLVAQPAPPEGFTEGLRLEVTNTAGAPIRVSRDGGRTWRVAGEALTPVERVNPAGYRASAWVPESSVAATAVNGIHVKVANHPRTGRGIIFSLVPGGRLAGAAQGTSSLVVDTEPGRGIFGGWGPTVGSPVLIQQEGQWEPLLPDYRPQQGDRWLLLRWVPEYPALYLDFENRFGGRITLTYRDGESVEVGRVLRPVNGVGRFEGTEYAGPGRIRANHAGVIDISTSPYGAVGGFQIIPWEHANDPEMHYVRPNDQWMVVGPTDLGAADGRGRFPLFSLLLYPSYDTAPELDPPRGERYLASSQVLAQLDGEEEWELFPRVAFALDAPSETARPESGTWWLPQPDSIYTPLTPAANRALLPVTGLRIRLPWIVFWPEERSDEPTVSDSAPHAEEAATAGKSAAE